MPFSYKNLILGSVHESAARVKYHFQMFLLNHHLWYNTTDYNMRIILHKYYRFNNCPRKVYCGIPPNMGRHSENVSDFN